MALPVIEQVGRRCRRVLDYRLRVTRITIVHTERGMLLSKADFADWREVQAAFEDYKVSIGPFSPDELIEYLRTEYLVNPPFEEVEIGEFTRSDVDEIWART